MHADRGLQLPGSAIIQFCHIESFGCGKRIIGYYLFIKLVISRATPAAFPHIHCPFQELGNFNTIHDYSLLDIIELSGIIVGRSRTFIRNASRRASDNKKLRRQFIIMYKNAIHRESSMKCEII